RIEVDAARALRRHAPTVEQQQRGVAADAAQVHSAREVGVGLAALHTAVRFVRAEVDHLRNGAHQIGSRDRWHGVDQIAAERERRRSDYLDTTNAAAGHDDFLWCRRRVLGGRWRGGKRKT